MLSEQNIIKTLKATFPNNIGDDAAVIPFTKTKSYVITKDLLLEDVHFRTRYYNPNDLAHKSLQVNLSDLIAMGAKPEYVLLGIGIPESYHNEIDNFIQAFMKVCKRNQITLIGGDTVKSADKIFISITAIGIANNKHLKFRSNATVGDIVCAAGNFGYAHVGFLALEKNVIKLEYFKQCFLKPHALTDVGLGLSKLPGITSLMDISDGLYVDLKKLCASSNVGAEIKLDNFIPTLDFITACNNLKINYLDAILCGGEDYGLLFTVKAKNFTAFSTFFAKNFKSNVWQLGKMTADTHITFTLAGNIITPSLHPFSHFGEEW